MKINLGLYVVMGALMSANPVFADSNQFSELELGFERIAYKESLSSIANQGKLQQSISVINPVLRNISYTQLSEDWGVFVRGSSTLATALETEHWSVAPFGQIQRNDFKIKYAELGVEGAYRYSLNGLILIGARFSTSSFTRSAFEKVSPGADEFQAAISPKNFTVLQGAISEDQYYFQCVTGYRYDSIQTAVGSLSYFAEAMTSVPLYSITQNTSIPNESLTASLNGWGVEVSAGMRYRIAPNLLVKLSTHASYNTRDEIVKHVEGSRVRVPNIEQKIMGVGAGLGWQF